MKVVIEIDVNEGENLDRYLPISGVVSRIGSCARVFAQLEAAGLGNAPLSKAIEVMGGTTGEDTFVFSEQAVDENAPVVSRVVLSVDAFNTNRLIPKEHATNVRTDEQMADTLSNMRKEHEREARN